MDHVQLGRTGLKVSVAGLGAGGPSRLGLRQGADRESPVNVVRNALELGVTFLDTAPTYGTEEIVGQAIAGRRDEVVLSTKVRTRGRDGGPLNDGAGVRSSVEESLRRLGTDVIDVLHVHAVLPEDYRHVADELVPVLEDLRSAGLVRFLAISEEFGADPGHEMLGHALDDDYWDVMMVGFHLLNPSARARVFPRTTEKGIGTLIMYAVRRTLSQPERLRAVLDELVADGSIAPGTLEGEDPLGFLLGAGGAGSVVEAAYRFARHEPGADVILTGTGSLEHLEENVASINAPPLPAETYSRVTELFGHLDNVSGN
jgi:L-galactose dehydrogenase